MQSLPNELLEKIVSYLEDEDVFRLVKIPYFRFRLHRIILKSSYTISELEKLYSGIPTDIFYIPYLHANSIPFDWNSQRIGELIPEYLILYDELYPSSLTRLDLEDRKITFWDPNLRRCRKLLELNLNYNQLTEIPDWISELSDLRSLEISYNRLKSLPDSIGDLNVDWLNLNGNQFQTLPETFGNLYRLRNLYLKSNRLTQLPVNIGKLHHLMTLNLNDNLLTQLPESFGKLSSLFYLTLNYNRLQFLPESFGNLRELYHLELKNNPLIELPSSFSRLQELREVHISSSKLNVPSLRNLRSINRD